MEDSTMTTSAKWTTVTFLAASALGAAAFAFGCTVTSGTVDDDGDAGGSSSGDPVSTPPATEDDGGTDAATATCEGNNQDLTKADFDPACQSCLEASCCTELKGCYNQTAEADGGIPVDDCNAYTQCILFCNNGDAGDPATCQSECDQATTQSIIDAYDAILSCGSANGCAEVCGI
jgi:hypothetical protein